MNPLKKCNRGPELGFWWNGEAPFWADAANPSVALQGCSLTYCCSQEAEYLGLPAAETLSRVVCTFLNFRF